MKGKIMKKILLLILCLCFYNCDNRKPFSSQTKKNFLDECALDNSISVYKYCDCILEKLMVKYDEETFLKQEIKYSLGHPDVEFLDFLTNSIADCQQLNESYGQEKSKLKNSSNLCNCIDTAHDDYGPGYYTNNKEYCDKIMYDFIGFHMFDDSVIDVDDDEYMEGLLKVMEECPIEY